MRKGTLAQSPARLEVLAHVINLLDSLVDLPIDVFLDLGLVLWMGLLGLWLATREELFLFRGGRGLLGFGEVRIV